MAGLKGHGYVWIFLGTLWHNDRLSDNGGKSGYTQDIGCGLQGAVWHHSPGIVVL